MKQTKIPTLVALFIAVLFLPIQVYAAGQVMYIKDANVRVGMLVVLTKNSNVVQPAEDKNASSLLGVVSDPGGRLDVAAGQVLVQTDGINDVLVSTANGDIKVGDRISPSSIVGLGVKNTTNGWILGTAQTSLDANTKGVAKTTVTDRLGVKREVYVGKVSVIVKVTEYGSEYLGGNKSSVVPEKIQSIADSLAGKRASLVAVFLSFILILSGVVLASLIVVTASRKIIEAVARQPLARQALAGRMLQSFAGAVGIVFSVVVGAVILLRLF